MGFGEEYQGMTEREIIVDLAANFKGFALVQEARDKALNAKIDRIQCPSPKCQQSFKLHEDEEKAIADHEIRLTEQERIEKERKERTLGRKEAALWIISGILGSGVLVFIIDRLGGH